MATTYIGSKAQAGVQPRVLPYGVEVSEISTFVITAAFVINDLVNFITLEANPSITGNGPTITGVTADIPSLDSSTGIVTAVGDSGTAARFITGSTVGRSGAGGIQVMNVAGTIGYQPFASSFGTYTTVSLQLYTIVFKVTTAATGTAATSGTIALKVTYTYDV